jgi:hypothetical protein
MTEVEARGVFFVHLPLMFCSLFAILFFKFPCLTNSNNCDMFSARQVSRTEAIQLAQDKMVYVECSAKDRSNIDMIFRILVTRVFQPAPGNVEEGGTNTYCLVQ